jgi:hypothetical protein
LLLVVIESLRVLMSHRTVCMMEVRIVEGRGSNC